MTLSPLRIKYNRKDMFNNFEEIEFEKEDVTVNGGGGEGSE